MEWKNGFTARYYYTVVDAPSWRDMERHKLTSGEISKTTDNLMESADLDLTEIPSENEIWIRVWLDARQAGDVGHEALFTGLLSVPSLEWDGTRKTYKAECYSVLKPAEDILLLRGWYAPAGTFGAEAAAELLGVSPAPIVIAENSPALTNSIVAEDGETNLSMAIKIVSAIGWRIRVTGAGVIQIVPQADQQTTRFDALENDAVEMSVTDTKDWFSCPNIFLATSNGVTAIARDDLESSPYSTVSRGREVWREETDCTLNDNESLEEYAARRLREEQSPARICNYSRRFHPDLYPGDVINLHYPAQNIDGDFRIRTQKIVLGYNAKTEEEVEELVRSLTAEIETEQTISLLVTDSNEYIVTNTGDNILIV